MPLLDQTRENILQWFSSAQEPTTWGQLALIGLAILVGMAAHRWVYRRFHDQLESASYQGLQRLGLRSMERLALPVGGLLVLLPALGLMRVAGMDTRLLDIVIPLFTSLAAIRLLVYLLRKSFTETPILKASEQIISFGIWFVVGLYLLGWLPALLNTLDAFAFHLGSTRISLLSSIKLVLMIGLMFTIAAWVARMVEGRVRRSRHLSRSMQVGISKTLKFTLLALAALMALDAVGIDLTALAVFGGALGVGIGFGLQRIASNFISGFILIFDRSIKPGDVITIGNKFGWVEEMRARYIVVRNRDGEENLIPNENLITSEVINWSYSDPNVRVKLPVQISYSDDPEVALELLLKAAGSCARVLSDPVPTARLIEFADSGIALELRVWINDPQNGIGNVRTEVNLAIWRAFKEAGITIPFPQRDVWLRRVDSDAE